MISFFKRFVVVSPAGMKHKSKGGQGKREEERNLALVTLYKSNPEYFNLSVLSRIFERDRKTIYDIFKVYGVGLK